jgi:hypothetical protein
MELVLKILICKWKLLQQLLDFGMTLFGLSLGFALLKVQGDIKSFNNNIFNIIK